MSSLQTGVLYCEDIKELNTLVHRDPKKVSSILQTIFSNAPCPFELALKVIRGSKYKNEPGSLCDYVVEALRKWTQENPHHDVPFAVKQEIVPLLCNVLDANSKILLFLFQVDKPTLALVEEHIHRFNQERNYTKMISLITMFNLQCPAYTDQLIIPMLVQGKDFHVHAKKYMEGSVVEQRSILSLVDTWLERFPIEQFSNASEPFIQPKALMKLLTKWEKLFPLLGADLPNLRRLKTVNKIRYLLNRYYHDIYMSARALEELVHKYINNDRDIAQTVCEMVRCKFNDPHRAYKLQQRYDPEGDSSVAVWSDSEDDPNAENYHPLKVGFHRVLMVDSAEKLSACEQDLHNMEGFDNSEECKLIGFDAEWFDDVLALIQLAVFDKVFLVDVYKLQQMGKTDELAAFVGRLFTSKRLLKLGFGVNNDLEVFSREFKSSMPANPTNLLDVMKLRSTHPRYKLLPPQQSHEAVDHCGKKLFGLSRMVFETLGKPLDKREQISDWEHRPLHLKQVIYAAIDAYCLLQVYEKLDKRLTDSGERNNKSLFSISCEASTPLGNNKQKTAHNAPTAEATSSSAPTLCEN